MLNETKFYFFFRRGSQYLSLLCFGAVQTENGSIFVRSSNVPENYSPKLSIDGIAGGIFLS